MCSADSAIRRKWLSVHRPPLLRTEVAPAEDGELPKDTAGPWGQVACIYSDFQHYPLYECHRSNAAGERRCSTHTHTQLSTAVLTGMWYRYIAAGDFRTGPSRYLHGFLPLPRFPSPPDGVHAFAVLHHWSEITPFQRAAHMLGREAEDFLPGETTPVNDSGCFHRHFPFSGSPPLSLY